MDSVPADALAETRVSTFTLLGAVLDVAGQLDRVHRRRGRRGCRLSSTGVVDSVDGELLELGARFWGSSPGGVLQEARTVASSRDLARAGSDRGALTGMDILRCVKHNFPLQTDKSLISRA